MASYNRHTIHTTDVCWDVTKPIDIATLERFVSTLKRKYGTASQLRIVDGRAIVKHYKIDDTRSMRANGATLRKAYDKQRLELRGNYRDSVEESED